MDICILKNLFSNVFRLRMNFPYKLVILVKWSPGVTSFVKSKVNLEAIVHGKSCKGSYA